MLPCLYLAEVHVDVFSSLLVELCASNLLSKVSKANGVARVELLDEKITAGLDHAVYLVHDGAVHHVDHTLFSYRDAGCVGELYESLHYLNRCKGGKTGQDRSRAERKGEDRKKKKKEKRSENEGKCVSEILFV